MKNEERSQDRGATRSRTVATTVLMVATFMDLMDSTITNVALPTIGKNLNATPEQLEWTLAGYVIAFATLLITGGRLGDIFGHRRIFVIGIVGSPSPPSGQRCRRQATCSSPPACFRAGSPESWCPRCSPAYR